MLRHDSPPRLPFSWAAVNGPATPCAAPWPNDSSPAPPTSRVNLEQTAGPDTDDDLALDYLGTAQQLESASSPVRGRKPGLVVPANGPHQLRGG